MAAEIGKRDVNRVTAAAGVTDDANLEFRNLRVDPTTNALKVTVATGDIEIGAVELKDGTTDTRAIINAANTARSATDNVLLVQTIAADGSVGGSAITSVVPGTGATNLGKAEDAVHASGDVGVMMLSVANAAQTTLAADGDYIGHAADTKGNTLVVGNIAGAGTDAGNPVKIGGIYNTTKPTYTNGQRSDGQANVNGALDIDEVASAQYEDNTTGVAAVAIKPLSVSTYSWTRFQNLQANATLNVKSTAGNVFSLYCHSIGGAASYIQLHNTATTPGGGATPLFSFIVPAGGSTVIDGDFFGENGANFSTGIAFAFSSTEITYTADTAGNQVTQIMFK